MKKQMEDNLGKFGNYGTSFTLDGVSCSLKIWAEMETGKGFCYEEKNTNRLPFVVWTGNVTQKQWSAFQTKFKAEKIVLRTLFEFYKRVGGGEH
jgi:hypothetical protein